MQSSFPFSASFFSFSFYFGREVGAESFALLVLEWSYSPIGINPSICPLTIDLDNSKWGVLKSSCWSANIRRHYFLLLKIGEVFALLTLC